MNWKKKLLVLAALMVSLGLQGCVGYRTTSINQQPAPVNSVGESAAYCKDLASENLASPNYQDVYLDELDATGGSSQSRSWHLLKCGQHAPGNQIRKNGQNLYGPSAMVEPRR